MPASKADKAKLNANKANVLAKQNKPSTTKNVATTTDAPHLFICESYSIDESAVAKTSFIDDNNFSIYNEQNSVVNDEGYVLVNANIIALNEVKIYYPQQEKFIKKRVPKTEINTVEEGYVSVNSGIGNYKARFPLSNVEVTGNVEQDYLNVNSNIGNYESYFSLDNVEAFDSEVTDVNPSNSYAFISSVMDSKRNNPFVTDKNAAHYQALASNQFEFIDSNQANVVVRKNVNFNKPFNNFTSYTLNFTPQYCSCCCHPSNKSNRKNKF